jgi:hypothetical protein
MQQLTGRLSSTRISCRWVESFCRSDIRQKLRPSGPSCSAWADCLEAPGDCNGSPGTHDLVRIEAEVKSCKLKKDRGVPEGKMGRRAG